MIRTDDRKYIVTFWGLINARSRAAGRAKLHCKVITKVLKKHFQRSQHTPLSLQDLAEKTKLGIEDVKNGARFLADSGFSLGLSPDFSALQTVTATENYLKFTFEQVVEQTRRDLQRAITAPVWLGRNSPWDTMHAHVGFLSSCSNDSIRDTVDKLSARVSSNDHEGAITLSRTLVECVCKHVLDLQAVSYNKNDSPTRLFKSAARALSLGPSPETEEAFRNVVTGCATAVDGLANIRNQLGDAHGKGRRAVRPGLRHAELAVGVACAVSEFLLATLDARSEP